MNTTAAATSAGVTIPTIRTWCRRGVIVATKAAGRWVIDAASLNRRIQIGARRARKATMSLDLTAATIKTRIRGGVTTTSVRGFAPLLADRLAAITDEGDRLHTEQALSGAVIAIRDQADEAEESGRYGYETFRDHGRIATTYAGTHHLPVDAVLDLAERIRAAL